MRLTAPKTKRNASQVNVRCSDSEKEKKVHFAVAVIFPPVLRDACSSLHHHALPLLHCLLGHSIWLTCTFLIPPLLCSV